MTITLNNNNNTTVSPSPIELSILPEDSQWETNIPKLHERITEAVSETLKTLAEESPLPPCEMTILLANDNRLQELNREFRHQDKPTNVLSFPNYSPDELDELTDELLNEPTADNIPLFLGDIAMAYETIARESKEQVKSLNDHMTHLVIHGTLHLFGYDHMNEDEALVMESLEIEILRKLNINNPYEEN